MTNKKQLKETSKLPSKRYEETKKYILTWHVRPVRMSKRSKKYLSLALCSKNNGVAYYLIHPTDDFDEMKRILLIKDVYVNDDCDDTKTCINLDCPLNKADLTNFRKNNITTKNELQKWHKTLEDVVQTLKLKAGLENKIIFYDHHIAYFNRQKTFKQHAKEEKQC